ncbi:hypothetical protein QX776_07335 [Alteromonadaceae bacterium BrNp21-10]|nr:hypothetical protein [Alteromonadaceae bacterium BrNp21-10]
MIYPELRFFPPVVSFLSDDTNKFPTSIGLLANGVAYQWNIIPQKSWHQEGYKLSESNHFSLQFLTYTGVSPEDIVKYFCRLTFEYNVVYSLDAEESVEYFKALNFDEMSADTKIGVSNITSLLDNYSEVSFSQEVIDNIKRHKLNTNHTVDRCVALALSIKHLHQNSTNLIF